MSQTGLYSLLSTHYVLSFPFELYIYPFGISGVGVPGQINRSEWGIYWEVDEGEPTEQLIQFCLWNKVLNCHVTVAPPYFCIYSICQSSVCHTASLALMSNVCPVPPLLMCPQGMTSSVSIHRTKIQQLCTFHSTWPLGRAGYKGCIFHLCFKQAKPKKCHS